MSHTQLWKGVSQNHKMCKSPVWPPQTLLVHYFPLPSTAAPSSILTSVFPLLVMLYYKHHPSHWCYSAHKILEFKEHIPCVVHALCTEVIRSVEKQIPSTGTLSRPASLVLRNVWSTWCGEESTGTQPKRCSCINYNIPVCKVWWQQTKFGEVFWALRCETAVTFDPCCACVHRVSPDVTRPIAWPCAAHAHIG